MWIGARKVEPAREWGLQRDKQSQEVEGDHFLIPLFEYLDLAMPEAVAFVLLNDVS